MQITTKNTIDLVTKLTQFDDHQWSTHADLYQ